MCLHSTTHRVLNEKYEKNRYVLLERNVTIKTNFCNLETENRDGDAKSVINVDRSGTARNYQRKMCRLLYNNDDVSFLLCGFDKLANEFVVLSLKAWFT